MPQVELSIPSLATYSVDAVSVEAKANENAGARRKTLRKDRDNLLFMVTSWAKMNGPFALRKRSEVEVGRMPSRGGSSQWPLVPLGHPSLTATENTSRWSGLSNEIMRMNRRPLKSSRTREKAPVLS
jgi:hypothetical protein